MIQIEPSADHRKIAAMTMQMFIAFVEVGFTEPDAMRLTKEWMGAAVLGGSR